MQDIISQLSFTYDDIASPEHNTKIRDFCGYRQHIEMEVNGKKRWKFYVVGFDATPAGENGFCYVLKSDNTTELVSIDNQDRILIDGRRYSRTHWNH